MTETTFHRLMFGAAAAVIAAVVTLVVTVFVQPDEVKLTTPGEVAAAFADAYAGGDTVRACELAGDQALNQLQKAGLCGATAGWNSTGQLTRTCYLPTRDAHSYEYRTEQPVNAHSGFDVLVTGGGTVWKVTTLTTHTGDSLCGIYGR